MPVGELALTVDVRQGRSIAVRQYHQGALRIFRPHYLDGTGQVCYTIVNPGGGYLGGDTYRIDIDVRPGAQLLLTSQSATKVYRAPAERTEQHLRIRLGAGSSLEFVPDQLIAYRDADYAQLTTIEMDATASLVMAEVLTPGWSPDGNLFTYRRVRLRNAITVDGELRVLDNLLLTPGHGSGVDGPWVLEQYTHLGSLLVVDARVDAQLVDEIRDLVLPLDPAGRCGVTLLDGPGFALRALSMSTEPLNRMIGAVVDLLRMRWRDQAPLNLRKY